MKPARWAYTFRYPDGTLVRWTYPNGSPRVEGGHQAAFARAQIQANLDRCPISVMRSRASDPYMGNGESFDDADVIGEVLPS